MGAASVGAVVVAGSVGAASVGAVVVAGSVGAASVGAVVVAGSVGAASVGAVVVAGSVRAASVGLWWCHHDFNNPLHSCCNLILYSVPYSVLHPAYSRDIRLKLKP